MENIEDQQTKVGEDDMDQTRKVFLSDDKLILQSPVDESEAGDEPVEEQVDTDESDDNEENEEVLSQNEELLEESVDEPEELSALDAEKIVNEAQIFVDVDEPDETVKKNVNNTQAIKILNIEK